MSSPENTVVSPLETTENQPPQPPPQKPHSPKSPQQSVTFFLGDEQSDENNNLNNDTSFTEGNTEASEAVETGVLDMSAPWRRSTVECLDSLRLSSGGLVKPSPSAASLDTLHELNDGSNGTTTATASGAAVKSNGGGGSSNGGNNNSHPAVASSSTAEHLMVEQAWDRLKKSYVFYKGQPVGTLAASDPSAEALNYNQVFVRDFFPSALACLMKEPPEADIVKNFLLKTLHLQGCEKKIDNFTLGEGVMPASFKVKYHEKRERVQETLEADYGGTAIGRVAPMDSGFWWIILLNSYVKCTRDYTLVDKPEVQRGIKLILNLCLSDGFDTFPSMLCADDCCMIDRRMGFYGYSMEIQALFFYALRCAKQMLKEGADNKELLDKIFEKMKAFRVQIHSWVDYTQLNTKYRYRTEDLCHNAVNKFNVSLESIPDWLFEFMPNDFIREMSLKISYPDYDPENTSFRGSWLGFLMVNEQLRQSLRTNFNLAKENLKKVNPLCKQSLNKVKPIWIGATNASSLPIGLFSLYSGLSKFDWQHMLEISKKAVKGALVENDNNIDQVRRELLDKEKQRIQEMEKELKENRKWHATVTIFGTFIGGLVGAGLGGFIGSRLQ